MGKPAVIGIKFRPGLKLLDQENQTWGGLVNKEGKFRPIKAEKRRLAWLGYSY